MKNLYVLLIRYTYDHNSSSEIQGDIFWEKNRRKYNWAQFLPDFSLANFTGEGPGDLFWGHLGVRKGQTSTSLHWEGNRDQGIRVLQKQQTTTIVLR